ncbi:MAG: Lrp/AsnC ligand binding domain-containing protein [Nitrosopumilus sp.]|nr:Lrp/AsnC ligand binding domain-containing protein [Nitrosopumilus sp.]MDF2422944.1 Lrp/AsnC ligand binding domain-containing protein [Nitrosopumilus sp.]MDF2424664.1 Lrp/AsnC ligand binding domain-containing protein [Nitrosopumilus sp.]MDF2424821.1 Lrp/AsnC ligand binding domain-containing protein [Nitrosopumilus sp.]MDF2427163.1 Lrp/AsnC ligand binding domain-containing protein [Nitrosopumilus sp.]
MEKAYMLISCDVGEEQSLYSQLKEIPGVKSCLITYGSYDIVAEFATDSASQITEIITSKIRKLSKIKSTITLRVTN